jgi:hypothetical protein
VGFSVDGDVVSYLEKTVEELPVALESDAKVLG